MENTGIFDIPESEGVNESERILIGLCRKSFLSLWAYGNPYTDEGRRNNKGDGKELCDVLVIFGNDVIVFSDKSAVFNSEKGIEVAWSRWYRKTVLRNYGQLQGALKWIRESPHRIFLDKGCTRKLPVEIPPADKIRVHLVAVTRGSVEACKDHFKGGHGTLAINTGLTGEDGEDGYFSIGNFNKEKYFSHVFDEVSLGFAMDELDTICDFVNYLKDREEFLSNGNYAVWASGEETLLATYILSWRDNKRSFSPSGAFNIVDGVIVDPSMYMTLKNLPAYKAMRQDNSISYFWDGLIERLIKFGSPCAATPALKAQSKSRSEQALRLLAAESRFRRKILVGRINDLLASASNDPTHSRMNYLYSEEYPRLVYLFFAVLQGNASRDKYREFRVEVMNAHLMCAKLDHPNADTFIGIGLEHPNNNYKGNSEDILVHTCTQLSESEAERMKMLKRNLQLHADGKKMEDIDTLLALANSKEEPRLGLKQNQKAHNSEKHISRMKRKSKTATMSKRRNRSR